MNWELLCVLALAAALLIYVLRHLPKAIEQLKKELGD